MGTVKDNLKSSDQKVQGMFDGIKQLVRPKELPKASAMTYVDLLSATDKTLNEMIIAKGRDVTNEKDRYDYNRFVLTELELQNHLLQQLMESAARCAEKKG